MAGPNTVILFLKDCPKGNFLFKKLLIYSAEVIEFNFSLKNIHFFNFHEIDKYLSLWIARESTFADQHSQCQPILLR